MWIQVGMCGWWIGKRAHTGRVTGSKARRPRLAKGLQASAARMVRPAAKPRAGPWRPKGGQL